MLKVIPIMLLSSVQKVIHYAQYYTHNYYNATVHNSYKNLLVSTFNA